MNKPVVRVFGVEFVVVAAEAQVSFAAEVDIATMVEEDPYANIELALLYEQRPLDVLLDDELPMLVGGTDLVRLRSYLLEIQLGHDRLLFRAHHESGDERVGGVLFGFRRDFLLCQCLGPLIGIGRCRCALGGAFLHRFSVLVGAWLLEVDDRPRQHGYVVFDHLIAFIIVTRFFVANFLLLCLLLIDFISEVLCLLLRNAFDVAVYQALDLSEIVADVYSLALIELGRFDDPVVMPGVMAERHAVAGEVLLQKLYNASIVVVELSDIHTAWIIDCLVVGVSLLSLFLLVLLNEQDLVLVEVLEDEVVVEKAL